MTDDLRNMIVAQCICDSLTLRSTGEKYFIYESYGVHYVGCAINGSKPQVGVIAWANSYTEIINRLLEELEEKISNS